MAAAVNRMLDAKMLAAVGKLLGDAFSNLSSDAFTLPIDADMSAPAGAYAIFARFGFVASSSLFAPQSWPRTITRCASLILVDQTGPIGPEVRRMYSSRDNGPLARLIVAQWLHSKDLNACHAFAKSGLETDSPAAFANDCLAVLAGTPRTKELMLQMAENLRSLSNEDVDAIAIVLRPEAASAFRAAVDELHSRKFALTERNVNIVLEQAWISGGRSIVMGELERLAATP